MKILLSDIFKPGAYTVISINGPETTRLLEMGITPGIALEVLRRAPMGYPIEIKVRGGLLTLRKPEAESIELEQ